MTGLIYIGKGAFVPGIPARDLTPDEVKQFGEDALLATGLYKKTASVSNSKLSNESMPASKPNKSGADAGKEKESQ